MSINFCLCANIVHIYIIFFIIITTSLYIVTLYANNLVPSLIHIIKTLLNALHILQHIYTCLQQVAAELNQTSMHARIHNN